MSGKDAAEFLKWMNATNDSVASQSASAVEAKIKSQVGVDPIREAREAERREDGPLRARPRERSRRKNQVRNAFGYVDPR